MFNEQFTNGSWITPFTDPPFALPGSGDPHDVSDYTIAMVPIASVTALVAASIRSLFRRRVPASLAILGAGSVRHRHDPSSSCLTGWTTGETWTNSGRCVASLPRGWRSS